jgi:hypothetical protein
VKREKRRHTVDTIRAPEHDYDHQADGLFLCASLPAHAPHGHCPLHGFRVMGDIRGVASGLFTFRHYAVGVFALAIFTLLPLIPRTASGDTIGSGVPVASLLGRGDPFFPPLIQATATDRYSPQTMPHGRIF